MPELPDKTGTDTLQNREKWTYVTAYGLTLLCVLLLQMAPSGLPTIGGARPLLLIPLTVYVAMFEGPVTGGVFGAVAGVLWGIFSQRLLGFDALLLLALGCICGLLVRMLLRNNLLTALLLGTGGTLAVSLIDWFFFTAIWTGSDSLYVLGCLVLPDVLYTVVLGPALYGILYAVIRRMKQAD